VLSCCGAGADAFVELAASERVPRQATPGGSRCAGRGTDHPHCTADDKQRRGSGGAVAQRWTGGQDGCALPQGEGHPRGVDAGVWRGARSSR
jgi:hypothetical protein